jgi:hypothetical protein
MSYRETKNNFSDVFFFQKELRKPRLSVIRNYLGAVREGVAQETLKGEPENKGGRKSGVLVFQISV